MRHPFYLLPRPAPLTRLRRVFLVLALLGLGLLTPRGAAAQVPRGRLAAGYRHSLAVTANGQLYGWGDNEAGQVGNGVPTGNVPTPVRIGTARNWAQVATGLNHSLAITADGQLYAWGENLHGQVGNGVANLDDVPEPVRISSANNWVQVAGAIHHSLALTADGHLYAWGRNGSGQVGNGVSSSTPVVFPTRIAPNHVWVQISAGGHQSLALTADGQLYSWGADNEGQVGNGPASSDNVLVPTRIAPDRVWAQVSAGGGHSMALTADGQLYVWGQDFFGQVGNGPASSSRVMEPLRIGTANNWAWIEAGLNHSLAMTADGQLYGWGYNANDQVGTGPAIGEVQQPTRIGTASNWTQVSAGGEHSMGLTADGRLSVWGRDNFGQQGNGPASSSQVPEPVIATAFPGGTLGYVQVAAGNSHSLGIRADGQLYAWGNDTNGRVGNGPASSSNVLAPERIGAASNWAQVAAGGRHSLALTADGQLYAWGNNTNGQVGNGTATGEVPAPVRIGTASNWVQVAAGSTHSLALTADGQLYAWGDDFFDQMGNGATTGNVVAPVRIGTANTWVQVAAGYDHSLALTADGQLYAWGRNSNGQIGNGQIGSGATTGNVPEPVRVGTASNWAQVAAGGFHSLALTSDGQLFAWGRNDYGQVGNGTGTGNVLAPVRESTAGTWVQVAGGTYYSMALTADGQLFAWGDDDYGQVGNGTATGNVPAPVRESTAGTWARLGRGGSGFHSLALNAVGEVQSAGLNNNGQLGDGTLVRAPSFARNRAPLPVELVAFTATATGRAAVRLAWATASEKNSQAFEVERSPDGRTFAPIGTVAAAGSSSAPRSYELLDGQLPSGAAQLYYRLRQVDRDGTFSYSPVRTVALTGAAAGLSLYPNPAHGAATLAGTVPGAVVTVYNVLGHEVLATTADATGTAALGLPAGLPTGVYVVRVGSKALRLTVE